MATVESSPGILDINLYRGDTYYFTATVNDSAGDPMDLTGYSVKAEIYSGGQPIVLTNTASITNKLKLSDKATLTTSANHSFDVGQSITVSGIDSDFNGTFTISEITANTISYTSPGDNVPSTPVSPAGTVVSSIKAEFQLGTGSLSSGIIYLFLPDGVTKQIPASTTYDVEIAKRINVANLGDSLADPNDDRWFVKTILRGNITILGDVTYSVTSLPNTRGQLS